MLHKKEVRRDDPMLIETTTPKRRVQESYGKAQECTTKTKNEKTGHQGQKEKFKICQLYIKNRILSTGLPALREDSGQYIQELYGRGSYIWSWARTLGHV